MEYDIKLQTMISQFMRTCIPMIWALGSLSLDSHNNSDIADAGNLMYPSHCGTQAGRVSQYT